MVKELLNDSSTVEHVVTLVNVVILLIIALITRWVLKIKKDTGEINHTVNNRDTTMRSDMDALARRQDRTDAKVDAVLLHVAGISKKLDTAVIKTVKDDE